MLGFNINRTIAGRFLLIALIAPLFSTTASAQLTWDPDANQVNDGGAGTWDTATANWDDDSTAPNTTWTNGSDATFGSGTYQVDLTSAGVTVGDLNYGGGGILEFRGSTASGSLGDAITINGGGATWDTGGGEIEFFNDGVNSNTRLSIASGDTLAVTGGGVFDTGQNPQNNVNGTWSAAGATLDVASDVTVRGDSLTAGQFGTIKLADGATYIHERNSDRGYANNWELDGTVTFDNRFSRNYTLNGEITGTGGIQIQSLGGRQITLTNNANSFSGGIEVAAGGRLLVNDEARLGDVANDITLSGGGLLRLQGVDLGSTREIILSGTGGSIVNDSSANTFAGRITGDGGLQIGNPALSNFSNVLTLTSDTSDYTGVTNIHNGSLALGVDNALSNSSVLTIGGSASTAQLLLNSFDQELGGLQSTGNNTRQINAGATTATLTLNVASGESYNYESNFVGDAAVDLVKSGDGTQIFNRAGGYTTAIGDVTVTGGELIWNNDNGSTISGAVAVSSTGSLGGLGVLGGAVTVDGNLSPGDATTGVATLGFDESLTLTSTATTALQISDLTNFDVLLNDGGDLLTAGGILTLDTTGYLASLGDVFQVFENWGTFTGSFDSISGTDLGSGLQFDTSDLLVGGTISVVSAAAVPEPSSVAFLGAVGLGFLVRRRRR